MIALKYIIVKVKHSPGKGECFLFVESGFVIMQTYGLLYMLCCRKIDI